MPGSQGSQLAGQQDFGEVKADLEGFEHKDLEVAAILIRKIAPKQPRQFVDPFPYEEQKAVDDLNASNAESAANKPKRIEKK